ncbi:MAG: hypothetical protein HC923_02370 [Myxococcales bacterium]|nr:hypothetical protein [Myxococcales bacterium]
MELPEGVDRLRLLFALLLADASPRQAEASLRDARASKELIRGVLELIRARGDLALVGPARTAALARWAASESGESVLLYALGIGAEEAARELRALRQSFERDPLPPRPLLRGEDLTALGLVPGPRFKRLLDDLDDTVLARRVRTREEALDWVRASNAEGLSEP